MKLAAGAAIGAGLLAAGFLKGAFGEAREAQKVGALTNAVIKSTGGVANVTAGQVDKLSTSLSNKIGVDDEAIAAGQNMLLTFTKVRNEVGKGNAIFTRATIAASDMAATFGGDATSNSKMLGKALNDPTKGVTALTRVGVSFTQQQKDQIKAMQESGNLLGAQKIILAEVTRQTKGSAEATATMGDKAKVAFGNLQESVGTALLPLWDKLLGGMTKFMILLTNDIGPGIAALNGFLAPAIAGVKSFFTSLTSGGGGVTSQFLPVLKTIGTTFTSSVLPALQRFGAYVVANVLPIVRQLATIFMTNVLPILSKVAQFIYGKLVPAVISIVTSIAGSLKPVFDALFQTIKVNVLPTVQKLLAKFQEWWPTISKVIMIVVKVVGAVLKLAAAILGKVLPPLIRFAGFLMRNIIGAVVAVIGIVVKIIGKIIAFGAAIIAGGKKAGEFAVTVKNKIGDAIGFVKDLPGKAKDALGNLATTLKDKGKALIQGLIDGITDKIEALKEKIRAAVQWVKDHLPGSPIKRGPLKSWNNTGPTGPGGRLMGLLADGVSNSSALQDAVAASTARLNVRARGFAGAGAAAGSTGAVFNIYDRSGDPTRTAHETARQLAFAGGA